MDRPHEFIAYPNGTFKSCVRCGRAKDHPIHKEGK